MRGEQLDTQVVVILRVYGLIRNNATAAFCRTQIGDDCRLNMATPINFTLSPPYRPPPPNNNNN